MRTSPVWIFAMLLQLQTEGIKGAVPIEVVAQKVVPLKWARAPAIIPMIPDKEPIIPPSRRAGNTRTRRWCLKEVWEPNNITQTGRDTDKNCDHEGFPWKLSTCYRETGRLLS
ncbi:hypothetical protein RR46_00986 [Papilio xuthus]|uniref:Uncharacterized protein n=1 Tax=Papilio xuthus TaxID=66420 RepID=A0A0N1PE99_PAPXU|nr:hypothetical protein RR46_00986 [Papilio xuthus]